MNLWIQINTGRTRGWIPEFINGVPTVEPWSEEAQTPQIPSNGAEQISIRLDDGSTFVARFDRERSLILNGGEYVISQIRLLEQRMSGKSSREQQSELLPYIFPNLRIIKGESDRNLDLIVNALCNQGQNCGQRPEYQVGDRRMDMSGPGNIVYGYFMTDFGWPMALQEVAANLDQGFREAFNFNRPRPDDPDDIRQREVGLALSQGRLSVEALEGLAEILSLY